MSVIRPKPIEGVYEKPFWDFVQRRELRLQLCPCGHVRFPPGPACPRCLSTEFLWAKVSGDGELVSWTVFHRPYFPGMPVPYVVACGALAEGPLLLANVVPETGAEPAGNRLAIGLPMRIVYEDARTRDGDFVIYQWALGRAST